MESVNGPAPEYPQNSKAARVYKISRDDQGNRLTHLKDLQEGLSKVKESYPAEIPKSHRETLAREKMQTGSAYYIRGPVQETVAGAEAGNHLHVPAPGTLSGAGDWGAGTGFHGSGAGAGAQVQLPENGGCDRAVMLPRVSAKLEEEDPLLRGGME